MRAVLRKSVVAILIGATPLLAQSAPAKPALATAKPAAKPHPHKARTKKQPLPEPGPPQPIAQMTPEQLPASPPKVTYRDGLLTVDSRNSTLADILGGIRRETGAQIDSPPSAKYERVAARLGPAAPRDVISALLNGSKFGYIIVGAPDNPAVVQRVMLSMLPAGGPSAAPPAVAAQNAPQPPPVEPSTDEEEPDVDRNPQPEPSPQATPAPLANPPNMGGRGQPNPNFVPGQPPQVPLGQPGFQPQQNQPGQPPQVKTPDELLQELQRLRQQQQQIQQQQQQLQGQQPQQQPPPE